LQAHDGDDGHDCPICLWLHYAAAVVLFAAAVFRVIFRIVNLIVALPRNPLIKLSLPANISRAPPELLLSAV
jgi:hypothetical protein